MLINVLLPHIFADDFVFPIYNANEFFVVNVFIYQVSHQYVPFIFHIGRHLIDMWVHLVILSFDNIEVQLNLLVEHYSYNNLISIIVHIPHLIWNSIINRICMNLTIAFNDLNAYVFVAIFYGLASRWSFAFETEF